VESNPQTWCDAAEQVIQTCLEKNGNIATNCSSLAVSAQQQGGVTLDRGPQHLGSNRYRKDRDRPSHPQPWALPASFMHFQEPRRLIQKEKSPHFAIAPIIGWHWRARSMWQTPSMALGISSGGNCTPAKKRPALAAGTKRPHVRRCFFPRDYRFAGNRAVIHGVEFHEVNRHEIAA
jgi:hypothetical protein